MTRFVILGAGNIAGKFADAVALLPDACVAAVASKSAERAEAFAALHHLPAAYGDYAEMLERERPDAAYIATTVNFHRELLELCIRRGVPALCEKAMFMNSADAKAVFGEARAAGVFLMEALWSRFLPPVQKARQWLQEGRIGELELIDSTLGFQPAYDDGNRFFNPALGGGAARDLLVYSYELAAFMAGGRPLETRQMHSRTPGGVDKQDLVEVRFPACLASLRAGFRAFGQQSQLVVYGSTGKLVLPEPHHGSLCTLYTADGKQEVFEQKVPNGFVFEIAEMIKCLGEGRLESPVVPWNDTLDCASLFDGIPLG